MKCTYGHPNSTDVEGGVDFPPAIGVVPAFAASAAGCWPWPSLGGGDEQVASQAWRVLGAVERRRGPIEGVLETYFATFHRSLPVVEQGGFSARLRRGDPSASFSTLVLAMVLNSELSSTAGGGREEGEELYIVVKRIWGLLTAGGEVSVELVQAGVIIAAWEHCRALHREAWLRIGACARMGNVLGVHRVLRQPASREAEKEGRQRVEEERCLWWGVVVLER